VSSAGSQVQLTPLHGGPNRYGQFSNPLPDDARIFPIAGWICPAVDPEHL
jgi:hypothetical protein